VAKQKRKRLPGRPLQPIETKKECRLTDGHETFATRFLTSTELAGLNQKAKEVSGGDVWWEESQLNIMFERLNV